MNSKKVGKVITLLALVFNVELALAEVESDVQYLQQRWAEVNYQLEGRAQRNAFEQLIEEAETIVAENSASAEVLIWNGIIKSTYAGARGGLGALKFAKQAKIDLELALEIDAEALSGSAYTSLGTLYFNVPGWPIGFGDNEKAEELLLQSLAINPAGIDNNYFYGSYLMNENRYQEARLYLLKAQQAPARINRVVADTGRQVEIADALERIQAAD